MIYKGPTTNSSKYQMKLKLATQEYIGVELTRKEFKQLVYKYKDGEMPISDRVVYALMNMDEFIKFALDEAKDL